MTDARASLEGLQTADRAPNISDAPTPWLRRGSPRAFGFRGVAPAARLPGKAEAEGVVDATATPPAARLPR